MDKIRVDFSILKRKVLFRKYLQKIIKKIKKDLGRIK